MSKKRLTYEVQEGGEWLDFDPKKEVLQIACCDCGLVHMREYEIVGKRIKHRVFRANRATAQIRRHKKTGLFGNNRTTYRIVR